MSLSPIKLKIHAEVARRIRQHARSSLKAEICGVMIGHHNEDTTVVEDCIRGEHSDQGGAHVTFTQDTWEHIYQIKDRDFPGKKIVGWYHSHPGFGVFLSDHDLFIHRNFFSAPHQVAWVYDPHSDEEGCFALADGEDVVRLEMVEIIEAKSNDGPVIREEPDSVPDSEGPPNRTSPPLEDTSPGAKLFKVFLYLTLVVFAFFGGFMLATKTLPTQKLKAKLDALPAPYSRELVRQVDFLSTLPSGISLLHVRSASSPNEGNTAGTMVRQLQYEYLPIYSEEIRPKLLEIAEHARDLYRLGGLQSGVNVRENFQIHRKRIVQGYTLIIRGKKGIQLISGPKLQDLFGLCWQLENEPLSPAVKNPDTPTAGNNATLTRDSNTTGIDRNANVSPDQNATTFPDRNATTLPDRNVTTPPDSNRTNPEANGTTP
ncbi:MAG: Mov34/MPN/PAD-1 family protein [Verrucomicrobiota bacterium]|jgi:proteasome lid subunit RPN8/RPN11|nr:Mov34/MPN/PAD-1 family protein [Verrucomicrobiota bacterium]